MTRRHEVGEAWQPHYRSRLVSAAAAVAHVRSGDRVWMSAGAWVDPLLVALAARADELTDVEVRGLPTTDIGWFSGAYRGRLDVNVLFALEPARKALEERHARYTPWWIMGQHKALDEGRPGASPVDVALISVSPPNEKGYVCFGHALWDAKTTSDRARTVLAVVNRHVPRTFGETWIQVSEVDWFVESAEALDDAEFMFPDPEPWDEAVAAHVASLVNDGDTIQIGTGSTTGNIARLGALDGKHDLGYFAELTVPGTIDLVRKGVITSKYMTTHPGKFVSTTAGNSVSDVAYINDNPMFEFYPTEYMHDPRVIARNDNLVAINNALTTDLTGQIGASTVGHRIYSGTGGHLAYALGAYMSRGGRYICVLPATAARGTKSRIVAEHEPGQAITVPRDLADIVVTEYGIAHLLNKTLRQRANELIAIAHPDFRADLRRQAERLY